ncbi:Protein CBG15890 [Caenorhabditis briggsae]|uniref:Protein CBG15890 n=1 Tax=Caenorhabditis briggsae TaxID=6238 RepID=A8XN04_CAEBR|nr:Protein CBG15890 [Caenorhabditis briggsae]CAP34030.2 Protein CBG15890 [Caenorhabditis briggsae]
MIPDLQSYYSSNYSKCNLSDNYLVTWEGLAYPGHIIQVVAAPIQIFTFYINLEKTPSFMKTIKWPLLINHFCSTLFDFMICTHFFIGIIIQTSIPLLTIIIPPLILIAQVLTDNYNQGLMNLGMILFGLNGLIESSEILLVYQPNWNAVKTILNFKKTQNPNYTSSRSLCKFEHWKELSSRRNVME